MLWPSGNSFYRDTRSHKPKSFHRRTRLRLLVYVLLYVLHDARLRRSFGLNNS